MAHFSGPYLTRMVEKRLREIAAEDVAPWVKLGDIIVRAARIRARGNDLVIESRVYDRNVLRQLDEASGGGPRKLVAPR